MSESNTLNLDDSAVQARFASLVGITQQAISRQVEKGVLVTGQTYKQWLFSYCEHMRDQAAGRGGSQQENTARAKIRESEANAQLKELQFHKEIKNLIPANEIEPMLANWATLARSETQHAVTKMVAAIESKHGIEVEQGLIDESLGAAFAAIANYPAQSSVDAGEGDAEMTG